MTGTDLLMAALGICVLTLAVIGAGSAWGLLMRWLWQRRVRRAIDGAYSCRDWKGEYGQGPQR